MGYIDKADRDRVMGMCQNLGDYYLQAEIYFCNFLISRKAITWGKKRAW